MKLLEKNHKAVVALLMVLLLTGFLSSAINISLADDDDDDDHTHTRTASTTTHSESTESTHTTHPKSTSTSSTETETTRTTSTTSTRTTETTITSTSTSETSTTTVMTSTSGSAATLTEQSVTIQAVNNTIIHETVTKVGYANGTVVETRRRIISAGDSAVLEYSERKVEDGQASSVFVKTVDVVSGIGAVVKLSKSGTAVGGGITMTKIENGVSVSDIDFSGHEIRAVVSAPDGYGSKLIVFDIDKSVVDISTATYPKIYVNEHEVLMADSVEDLLTGRLSSPAYVAIITAKKLEAMIYIPHFSSYQLRISFGKAVDSTRVELLSDVPSGVSGLMLAVVTVMFVMSFALVLVATRRSGRASPQPY